MLTWFDRHRLQTLVIGLAIVGAALISLFAHFLLLGEIGKLLLGFIQNIVQFTNNFGVAITALATIAVAFFTCTLWVVTNRSVRVAEAAANVLPILERAYVYPVVVWSNGLLEAVRQAQVHFLGEDDGNKETPHRGIILARVENFGKTPGIIKQFTADIFVAPASDGYRTELPVAQSILAAGGTSGEIKIGMRRGLTRAQANHFSSATAHFEFDGWLKYLDIWGEEWITEFTYVLDRSINPADPSTNPIMRLVRLNTKKADDSQFAN